MSATDELRRMLDERGVEWDYGITGSTTTMLIVNGIDLTFTPMRDGLVCSTILTPEQAIAATLGRGTCHNAAPSYLDFLCSACGFVHYHSDTNDTGDGNDWSFCPNCGRKVVDELSMLSAQCDELRSMTESVWLAMPQAATLMMEAADTIWELRGSVHRERAEADKLRELARAAWRCIHTGASCSDCRLIAGGCTLQSAMRELGVEVE